MERTMPQRDGAPHDVIAASIARERARVGISLAELARRAGIAKSTLSQLEAGTGNPSVEVLWALGRALDVPFARLVEPDVPPIRVVRHGEGAWFRAERSDYATTLLSGGPPGVRRDLYLVEHEPGPARESEPHPRGTIEHVVLTTGRALVGPSDAAVELGPGDYCTYPGDVAHVFQALEPGTAAVCISEQS
jgi:transcriptional regulator with XRE-family HTH domain